MIRPSHSGPPVQPNSGEAVVPIVCIVASGLRTHDPGARYEATGRFGGLPLYNMKGAASRRPPKQVAGRRNPDAGYASWARRKFILEINLRHSCRKGGEQMAGPAQSQLMPAQSLTDSNGRFGAHLAGAFAPEATRSFIPSLNGEATWEPIIGKTVAPR